MDFIKQILEVPAETRTLEFKRLGAQLKPNKIVESIVAMANTDGGLIVLGIDDPEKSTLKGYERIFGIEENNELFDEIGRLISRITPPLPNLWPPALFKHEANKTVATILIGKSTSEFHSVDNHVFIRLEKGNKLLTPHEITKLSYAKGFQQADRELVDIDFSLLLTEYYERWRNERKINNSDIKEVLFSTGLARKETGILKPTRAAVMLFALHPHDLLETKCTIRIFQYEGTIEKIGETLNLISKPKTIEGPIIKQIADAHEYVLMLLRAGMRIPSSGFINTYKIPERAVKESITNAVIHRDYYLKRDIEVRLFEDRLEIESPGLFPSNITLFNIGLVRSEGYRNDLLVKHLREFPDPPNLDRNEGVVAMRQEMYKGNLYPPVFFTYPHFQDAVNVVLFNTVRATEWEKVQTYLQSKEKYVNNEQVRKIIGNPDTSKVSRLLKQWSTRGLLIKVETGSKKKTKYRLSSGEDQSPLFADSRANK